jgi:hypothetical protein
VTTIQAISAAAAVALALYPQAKQAYQWAVGLWQQGGWPVAPPSKGAAAPSYQEAIIDIADIRHRLAATDRLGDPQKKAIDVLTLALVDGSDL